VSLVGAGWDSILSLTVLSPTDRERKQRSVFQDFVDRFEVAADFV
jgi:hypothetical protein